jgi:hypothetical protein
MQQNKEKSIAKNLCSAIAFTLFRDKLNVQICSFASKIACRQLDNSHQVMSPIKRTSHWSDKSQTRAFVFRVKDVQLLMEQCIFGEEVRFTAWEVGDSTEHN